MNGAVKPPLLPSRMAAPTPQQALHRLFLTLFLRGRGARGLNQKSAPKSIGDKLSLTLLFYFLFGCLAFTMLGQKVFALSVYLHTMTFAFLGMFVASSAGEILFNKEEGDILMHRPVDARTMLWSKIRVLVEVSLWLAGAFNAAGLIAGLLLPDGGWRFLVAHALSTAFEALFCAGCVVLIYQLCLRWFGRDRLEGLMTLMQVLISVAAVMSGQILPRLIFRFGKMLAPSQSSWWIAVLPPAWFAGFDDALAGSGARISWALGACAVAATGVVLWLAFDKLANTYETGLQTLSEVSARKVKKPGRRFMDRLINVPPLSWWLREPVSRAAFLLTIAYLVRDRDVKLRVYPGIAPMLILPFVFLFQPISDMSGFGVAFSGAYLGLIPLLSLGMLQYSQQWQAADVFRSAPMRGPGPICHGARRAVLCFLTFPMMAAVAALIGWMHGFNSQMLLLLPGAIAVPVYALVPAVFGGSIPLSSPVEAAKAASRGLRMVLVMFIAIALSGLALLARTKGWFWEFVGVETIVVAGVYFAMRSALDRVPWQSAE